MKQKWIMLNEINATWAHLDVSSYTKSEGESGGLVPVGSSFLFLLVIVNGTRWLLRSLLTQTVLWPYDSIQSFPRSSKEFLEGLYSDLHSLLGSRISPCPAVPEQWYMPCHRADKVAHRATQGQIGIDRRTLMISQVVYALDCAGMLKRNC